jgi:hypothetical protein
MWISDTRSTRIGQTVFFKHKYITQPTVTAADALVQAPEEMCQVLKGLSPIKGETRTAVELLVDIFKKVGSEEETDVDAQRKQVGEAANKRTKSDEAEAELEGIWTAPNKLDLADNNLRTTESVQITHPAKMGGRSSLKMKSQH